MNKGTIGTRILERSIIKHIVKGSTHGVGPGHDYSVLNLSDDSDKYIVTSQGFSETDTNMPGASDQDFSFVSGAELGLIRAENNLATCGAKPYEMLVTITAGGDVGEQILRDEMSKVCYLAKEKKIRISGGNTVYMGEGSSVGTTITLFGELDKKVYDQLNQKIRPGDKIYIYGNAGEFGASVLADCRDERIKEKIRERFADSFLDEMKMSKDSLYIHLPALSFIEAGACYIHDVSYGGIYRTLYELSEYSGLGVDIIHENVPIKQSTIEICETLGLNPYEIMGPGAFAAVVSASDAGAFEESLKKKGISFSQAGEMTQKKEKVVHSASYRMQRFLTPYDTDLAASLRSL